MTMKRYIIIVIDPMTTITLLLIVNIGKLTNVAKRSNGYETMIVVNNQKTILTLLYPL